MSYRSSSQNQIILENLESVHRSFKQSLGVMGKTRKWAIWQLQGASLAIASRAIKYQEERNDMIAILMLSRLSSEFLSQVGYLANPATKAVAVKKWQRVWNPLLGYPTTLNDIPYSHHKKRPDTSTRTVKMPAGIDFSLGDYNAELNHVQSLWAHPSYDLTRRLFETDKNNGGYEMYSFKNPFYSDSVADNVTRFIIDNAARVIHIGSYLYGQPISYQDLLSIK